MVGPAHVRLVLRVAADVANLLDAVGELTLLAVLASAVLLEWAAHLSFVARGLLDRRRGGGAGGVRAAVLAGPPRPHRAVPVAGQRLSQGGVGRPKSEPELVGLPALRLNLNPQALETVLLDLKVRALSVMSLLINKLYCRNYIKIWSRFPNKDLAATALLWGYFPRQ